MIHTSKCQIFFNSPLVRFKSKNCNLARLHGEDSVIVATYISSLLNGIDLRFRQMSNPKIRLNLAGIIIPEVRK